MNDLSITHITIDTGTGGPDKLCIHTTLWLPRSINFDSPKPLTIEIEAQAGTGMAYALTQFPGVEVQVCDFSGISRWTPYTTKTN